MLLPPVSEFCYVLLNTHYFSVSLILFHFKTFVVFFSLCARLNWQFSSANHIVVEIMLILLV